MAAARAVASAITLRQSVDRRAGYTKRENERAMPQRSST